MESLLLGLAVLACPVGMGVMMWLMGRGRRQTLGPRPGNEQQIALLRAEIDQLKAERANDRARSEY
ncbi:MULTISPECIES: hypothetical protein [Prauserella]|uniref:Uncharacterized protein n=2 Tax=Prauserella TaxID=142577 RepID=A0A318L937_9PSEU|nr:MULTISPECIES: hypothetical protein [Prauserella]PXY17562.1 hypothetical protein BA062_37390 [Prauserella flavalba]PXY18612.1 hypothetical protein BAY59_33585 [Prauserella coralliicola]TKG63544.1 hypothetical protein FCN18_30010 [Prauserella endophytica]